MAAPLSRLIVDQGLWVRLCALLRQAAPQEGCGLIATVGERAVALFPGTNVEGRADHYTMDPREVLAALTEIDAAGWRLGAIYHSHPRGPAWPSPNDLREAAYPDALAVIVSLADLDHPEAAAFDLTGHGACPVPLLIE